MYSVRCGQPNKYRSSQPHSQIIASGLIDPAKLLNTLDQRFGQGNYYVEVGDTGHPALATGIADQFADAP